MFTLNVHQVSLHQWWKLLVQRLRVYWLLSVFQQNHLGMQHWSCIALLSLSKLSNFDWISPNILNFQRHCTGYLLLLVTDNNYDTKNIECKCISKLLGVDWFRLVWHEVSWFSLLSAVCLWSFYILDPQRGKPSIVLDSFPMLLREYFDGRLGFRKFRHNSRVGYYAVKVWEFGQRE